MESSCDLGVDKDFLDKTHICKSKIIKINLEFIKNINSPFKIHLRKGKGETEWEEMFIMHILQNPI